MFAVSELSSCLAGESLLFHCVSWSQRKEKSSHLESKGSREASLLQLNRPKAPGSLGVRGGEAETRDDCGSLGTLVWLSLSALLTRDDTCLKLSG